MNIITPGNILSHSVVSEFMRSAAQVNNEMNSHIRFHDIVQGQMLAMTENDLNKKENFPIGSSFNLIKGIIANTGQKLDQQDIVLKKYLVGDASLTDVLAYSHEASNQLKLIVEIKNKFLESLDKVMNMSL